MFPNSDMASYAAVIDFQLFIISNELHLANTTVVSSFSSNANDSLSNIFYPNTKLSSSASSSLSSPHSADCGWSHSWLSSSECIIIILNIVSTI